MLEVPIYDESGQKTGSEQIDEALLGGAVNHDLLKQAIVMYQANKRQADAIQKSRGEVAGSTRKLYRQKGTGRARMGSIRTPVRRGGGNAFPKKNNNYRKRMPVKMRRLARDCAVLAKIQGEDALIVDGLGFDAPKTSRLASVLGALGLDRGCLIATDGADHNLLLSGRNLPRTEISDVADLNALMILMRRRLVFTKAAFAKYRALAETASKLRKAERSAPVGD